MQPGIYIIFRSVSTTPLNPDFTRRPVRMKTALALLLAASATPPQSPSGDYSAAEAAYRRDHAWSGLATLYLETNRLPDAEAA